MIHLLTVGPNLAPPKLKKLARRHAMTGGYEIALQPGLSPEDLSRIAELYIPEALRYEPGFALFKANNAFRILALIQDHPETPVSMRARITSEVLDREETSSSPHVGHSGVSRM